MKSHLFQTAVLLQGSSKKCITFIFTYLIKYLYARYPCCLEPLELVKSGASKDCQREVH